MQKAAPRTSDGAPGRELGIGWTYFPQFTCQQGISVHSCSLGEEIADGVFGVVRLNVPFPLSVSPQLERQAEVPSTVAQPTPWGNRD